MIREEKNYYSPTYNEWYIESNSIIPSDAIEISFDIKEKCFLMASEGKPFQPDQNGFPFNPSIPDDYSHLHEWDIEKQQYTISQENKNELEKLNVKFKKSELESKLDDVNDKLTRLERVRRRSEKQEEEYQVLLDQNESLLSELDELEIKIETFKEKNKNS